MNPPDFSVVKSRNSYLPAGTKWIDFWTGETFEGGQNVEKQTPIDIMPLYIKAGSVIPMGEFVQYANEKKGTVELRIYPGADGKFVLYDDERDNYNYEKGAYATIDLQWNDEEKKLTIGEREGSYKGMSKKITFNIVVVDENKGVGIELPRYDKTLTYKGKKVEIEL